MALSASKDYSITRADIIEGALRKLGTFDQGESISGEETNAADQQLNLMVKEWVARGVDIWLRDEITLFLQPDTQSYQLGTANATASYVETTLTGTESSGETVIAVASSTGMTAGDFVGIKLNDDTIFWSTISTVDNATQITIADATTGAAASGKKVYAYTTKAGRPTKLVYAFRRDKHGYDTEVRRVGEEEYRGQSNKASSGPPIEVWYQPTMTTGTLYVWPVDGGANWDKLVLIGQYYPDDFDSASNNPQFPIEWGNALTWGLAAELASEYGLPEREQGRLWQVAEHKLNELLDYDVENASVIFSVNADNR
jgi:hypothetical protein